jgi:hypothetical protein
MMGEVRHVNVADGTGVQIAELTIATEPPWWLEISLPDGETVEIEGTDLFQALQLLRGRLEPRGMRVCCQGARPDVLPSGMARQMGGGRRAYRLVPGGPVGLDALVDIFDVADCDDVVTVDEQNAAVRFFFDHR